MRSHPPLLSRILALLGLLALISCTATARPAGGGLVAMQTITVVDDAHMLSARTVRDAVSRIARITDRCHASIWIITVPAIAGRPAGDIAQRYTGRRPVGITVVMGRRERRTTFAVNSNQWNVVDLSRIKCAMDTHLKQGRPDQAVLDGLARLEAAL